MNSTIRCAETVRVRSFLRILWCVWTTTTTTVVIRTLLWCGNSLSQIHSRKCWKSKVNIRLELDLCRKSCKLKTINIVVFCMLTFLTHMLSCYILLSIILVISTIFHRKTLQKNIRKMYFLLK